MKLSGRHVLIAVAVFLLGALPALALGQSPFHDERQAANAQYSGTTTATTTTTPTNTVTGAGTTDTSPTTPTDDEEPTDTDDDEMPNDEEGGTNPSGVAGAANPFAGGAPCIFVATFGEADPELQAFVELVTGKPAYSGQLRQPISLKSLALADDATLGQIKAQGKNFGETASRFQSAYNQFAPESAEGVSALFGTSLVDKPQAACAVIVIGTPPVDGLDKDELANRKALIQGFITGLVKDHELRQANNDVELPIADVEGTETDPSQISFYKSIYYTDSDGKKHNISTVDNVDTKVGRQALAAILAGYEGHFGTKKTADALLPKGPDGKPLSFSTASSSADPINPLASDGSSAWALVLLALVASGGLLVLVERRTRKLRSRS